MTKVDGIGDGAHWSAKMKQLTVLSGNRMFHVGVAIELEDAANLELAKKLTAAILAK